MTAHRKPNYTNTSQQRLVKVILALFSDAVVGVSPSALAKAVGCSPSVMTSDLRNLATAGVAQRDEDTGLWRLTPLFPQQSMKVWTALNRHEHRLEECKQRFSRNPD